MDGNGNDTLVYADAGSFALSSGGGVWVRDEARAMWSAKYDVMEALQ